MFVDDYKYQSAGFSVSPGEHEVIIRHAEVKQAKAGRQLIEVMMEVPDGNGGAYIERYVEGEYFNAKISRFFDAFGLEPGNFSFSAWKGKRAIATFALEEDTYNGKTTMRPRIKRLDSLDKWEGGGAPAPAPDPTNPPNDYLKGGVATDAEKAALKALYEATFKTGSPVFSPEEVERFKDRRRYFTASELIITVKETLARRLLAEEPARSSALMDEVRAAREAQEQEALPVF